MSALEKLRAAAAEGAVDPDARATFIVPLRKGGEIGLRLRPCSWRDDRNNDVQVAQQKDAGDQVKIAASFVARHTDAVLDALDDDSTGPLYADGTEGLLDRRLADELEVTFVSSGDLLLRLVNEDAVEALWREHSEWSLPRGNRKVRRLGE